MEECGSLKLRRAERGTTPSTRVVCLQDSHLHAGGTTSPSLITTPELNGHRLYRTFLQRGELHMVCWLQGWEWEAARAARTARRAREILSPNFWKTWRRSRWWYFQNTHTNKCVFVESLWQLCNLLLGMRHWHVPNLLHTFFWIQLGRLHSSFLWSKSWQSRQQGWRRRWRDGSRIQPPERKQRAQPHRGRPGRFPRHAPRPRRMAHTRSLLASRVAPGEEKDWRVPEYAPQSEPLELSTRPLLGSLTNNGEHVTDLVAHACNNLYRWRK